MSSVYVIGQGATPIGRHTGKTIRELMVEASADLFETTPIKPDLIIVANMASPQFTNQNHLGVFLTDNLGLTGIPAFRVETACSSSGTAIHNAFLAIKSGLYNSVLIVGAEKMTEATTPEATSYLAGASDFDWEVAPGISFPGLNAMIAKRYLHDHNLEMEDLTRFSVYAHKHGVNNPKAMFQKEISLEKAMGSPMISDPLRLFDCSPVSDGSAAALIVSEKVRKEHKDLDAVELVASRVATDTISLQERQELTFLHACKLAGEQAFKDAGITWKQIKDFNIHDAFTIMSALTLEALGVTKRGEATKLAKEGQIMFDGDVPVNTMGGLKARGHPVGATGLYQLTENYLQLVGKAGKNQVPDIEYALCQNIGGSGATISVNITRRI